MTRWIVQASLQFRFLVVALAAVLVLVGLARLRDMPVDVLPEFAPPFVEIQTEALGLSTAEVESLISLNLEELLNGTPGRQTIRSTSVPGLSSVIIVFEPGTDVIRARQLVQERLVLSHMLPNVSQPPVLLQPLSATSRVMAVGLTSRDLSLIDLSVLARWKIRPAIMGVPGVANVAIWGQRERQLQVRVDPELLRANGVTLDQVIKTAGNAMWVSPLSFLNASTPGTGGWIDTPQQRLEVRHVLPISTADDLARVSVEGTPLRLTDVATVVENHQPLIGDAILNGQPGLLLVVEKFPASNTIEVTRAVEASLSALRAGLPGVEIDTSVFRPATFIELAVANLSRTLLVSAALVGLILLAFLFHWRVALISAVAIPLSIIAALLVLSLRGATANVMVLAGLAMAIGAIVDDAIGDVENMARRLREHRRAGSERPTAATLVACSAELRGALLFATLIAVLLVLPVFFLAGVSGALFRPLALSYVLALLASAAVALTITPALGLMLLPSAPLERRHSPLIPRLQQGYGRLLGGTLRRPRLAYVTVAALVLAGLAVLPFLRQESLLPAFKEPDLMVQWQGTPGTSHPEMVRITTQAGQELQSIPGIRNLGAHVGRAVMGDEVVDINAAKLWVSVDPKADYDATVSAIRAAVDRYPGLVRDVRTYLQDTLQQVLTGSSDSIVARIYGPQLDVLRDKAEEVRQALSGIDGVADLQVERLVEEPNVEIEVDLARAERYGIRPGDVRRAAATLVNGIEVGNLFEDQKVFNVVVWSTPDTRQSLTSLRELLIDTPGGGHVRLQDVADIRVRPSLNAIQREAVSRRIDVSLNVRGRDLGVVAQDVERALQQVAFPLEYHAELLGEYAERQAAQQRLLLAGLVAVIGIFLLLQAALQSWRLASLAFFTLPWALVGGLLATFFVSGGTLSLGSLVGFLTILGIATRNGIMLLSHYRHLQDEEGEAFGPALVLRGSRERAVPIIMTALATGLAFLPFALLGPRPGHELLYPMGIAILGGLVTSTLLNLFILPTLYWRTVSAGHGRLAPVPTTGPLPAR